MTHDIIDRNRCQLTLGWTFNFTLTLMTILLEPSDQDKTGINLEVP